MLIELRLPGPIDGGSQLKNLKSLYQNVHWEDRKQRVEFVHRLLDLSSKWRGTFPNLRKILQTEEIDQLLLDCVNSIINGKFESEKLYQFIAFVVRTGYKDEPIFGMDGKPLSRRTTAIHRAAITKCSEIFIRELFKIYNRFDVNYVDEFGFTHLHVACGYGLDYHVTKFLELGQVDPNCIERLTGNSPLHVALTSTAEKRESVKWLLRSDANPFLANKDSSTPLHIVCKKKQAYLSILDMFFRICDDKRQTGKIDALDLYGRTPLHYACSSHNSQAMELLLRRGADPYLADRYGLTPLHMICKQKQADCSLEISKQKPPGCILGMSKQIQDDCILEMFFGFCDDERQKEKINASDKLGRTPLHYACRSVNERAVESLLRRGANPYLADTVGWTPLYIICDNMCRYPNLARIFFEIIDEKQMDVRNEKITPLTLALRQEHAKIESLLTKSVIIERNLADGNELTNPQVINKRHRENDLARMIFEFSVDENLLACINAQDHDGDLPLYLALRSRSNWAAEWLLKNGANPNLAVAEGQNSLHAICQPIKCAEENEQVDLMKTIFEHCHKKYLPLQIDAQNDYGQTPLQWAVACGHLDLVDLLLDKCADLSGFTFPTDDHFAWILQLQGNVNEPLVSKFRSVSGTLAIVERLESKGYELDLSGALTILKIFNRLGFIDEPATRGRIKKKIIDKIAQETMIKSDLSLHNLFESTKKQITFTDYYEFARTDKLSTLSKSMRIIEIIVGRLSKIMLKTFIRKWALESFLILIHHRLSLECSEMIIDKSYTFRDLYTICLAAEMPVE